MRLALTLPQLEHTTRRCCGTCMHLQKSPLPGLGWCRNSKLRSDYERALVSPNDYRCFEMLDDFWEPAEEAPSLESSIPTGLQALGAIGFPRLTMRYLYAVGLSVILAVVAVALFSGNVLSTPVVSKPSAVSYAAEAGQDFWLREDATSALPSAMYVSTGSKLELIDSKAGEVIDPSSPAPSKWYKLKVNDTGEIGWAYSGWVQRR